MRLVFMFVADMRFGQPGTRKGGRRYDLRAGLLFLRVQTEFFTAGAVWQKIYGIWSCTSAAPKIRWLQGMNPAQAKLALERMNASFTFRPLQPRGQSTGHRPLRGPDGTLNIAPRDLLTPESGDRGGMNSDRIAATPSLQTSRSTTHCRTAKDYARALSKADDARRIRPMT
jgi:hypothetical protein